MLRGNVAYDLEAVAKRRTQGCVSPSGTFLDSARTQWKNMKHGTVTLFGGGSGGQVGKEWSHKQSLPSPSSGMVWKTSKANHDTALWANVLKSIQGSITGWGLGKSVTQQWSIHMYLVTPNPLMDSTCWRIDHPCVQWGIADDVHITFLHTHRCLLISIRTSIKDKNERWNQSPVFSDRYHVTAVFDDVLSKTVKDLSQGASHCLCVDSCHSFTV